MKRVIFVGLHNKPHLTPLCSSTKTGKIIDKIISGLPGGVTAIKSNIYNIDHFPCDEDNIHELIREWHESYKSDFQEDVIVALGKHVQAVLNNTGEISFVKLVHPACLFSSVKVSDYVANALDLIIAKIQK